MLKYIPLYVCIFLFVGSAPGILGSAHAPTGLVMGNAADEAGEFIEFAERFWEKRGGEVNCPSGIAVNWSPPSDSKYLAWAIQGGCHMWINPSGFWDRVSPGNKCSTILHEYGHLIGLGHDPRKNHIMYPTAVMTHPACRRFNRRIDLWARDIYNPDRIPYAPTK